MVRLAVKNLKRNSSSGITILTTKGIDNDDAETKKFYGDMQKVLIFA